MNRLLSLLLPIILLAAAGCGSDTQDPAVIDTDTTAVEADTLRSAAAADVQGGYQQVRITVRNDGYEPARISLQEGVPARLIFEQQATSACAGAVQIPAFDVAATDLPQGEETVIEFTPDETGEFQFVCGMEMLSGTLVVRS